MSFVVTFTSPLNASDLSLMTAMGASPALVANPTPAATPTPVATPTPSVPAAILTMTPVTTAGAPVTIGSGPDSLVLLLANFNTASNVVAVSINGVVVAAPLTVTSGAGMSASTSQVFTINGSWGAALPTVQIIAVAGGENGVWINGVTYNFVPLVFNGQIPSSDGPDIGVNVLSIWNMTNAPATFTAPIAVAPAAPAAPVIPPATPSATLTAVVASMTAGATTALPAATYIGTASINVAGTLSGATTATTIIDGTNIVPTQEKAGLVFTVPGATVENMTIQNFAISAALGQNASSVRDAGPGIGGTLVNVKSTGNQDGLLTSGGSWNLTGCTFAGNGAGNPGSGATHEMYFATDTANVVTLTNTTAACGPLATHALKSRAKTTRATGCTFTANYTDPTNGGNAGSVIDIPDGGTFTATGCTINLPAGSANTNFVTCGEESANNGAAIVSMETCVFVDGTGTGGTIVCSSAGGTINVTGSTYTGTVAPKLTGWATVVGTIAKAA
jgi:hypothetical protein